MSGEISAGIYIKIAEKSVSSFSLNTNKCT